jgi:hypothetical protein
MARFAALEPSVATMMRCIESVLRAIAAKEGRVVSHRQVALSTREVAGRMQRE